MISYLEKLDFRSGVRLLPCHTPRFIFFFSLSSQNMSSVPTTKRIRVEVEEDFFGDCDINRAVLVDAANAPSTQGKSLSDLITLWEQLEQYRAASLATMREVERRVLAEHTGELACKRCKTALTKATAYYDATALLSDAWRTSLCKRCYRSSDYAGKDFRSESADIYYSVRFDTGFKDMRAVHRLDFDAVPSGVELHEAIKKLVPQHKNVLVRGNGAPIKETDEKASRPGVGYRGLLTVFPAE